MTETIQETRIREAMEPLGEILGSLQHNVKQGTVSYLYVILLISTVGGMIFGDNETLTTKKITLFAFLLMIAFTIAYFERKNLKQLKAISKKIETEPYESKNDLTKARDTVSNIIPIIYPKYSHWISFII